MKIAYIYKGVITMKNIFFNQKIRINNNHKKNDQIKNNVSKKQEEEYDSINQSHTLITPKGA